MKFREVLAVSALTSGCFEAPADVKCELNTGDAGVLLKNIAEVENVCREEPGSGITCLYEVEDGVDHTYTLSEYPCGQEDLAVMNEGFRTGAINACGVDVKAECSNPEATEFLNCTKEEDSSKCKKS